MRRLVAGCAAQLIGPEIEEACAPHQYAMSTRAGTDCIGHLLKGLAAVEPDHCILSIDGVGAFDFVQGASMLSEVNELLVAS